jgi:hypothetical protein
VADANFSGPVAVGFVAANISLVLAASAAPSVEKKNLLRVQSVMACPRSCESGLESNTAPKFGAVVHGALSDYEFDGANIVD